MMMHRLTRRRARRAALALLPLLVVSPLVAQQVTGKIEGTVTGPAGQPIARAQVAIVGTAARVFTSERGYYFFNNVPVGVYTVRARFIGLQALEVPRVRILGGQTITLDLRLRDAVALEPIVVSAREGPIVPRDQVSSRSTITGETVNQLPLDDVRSLVALMPGVVESGDPTGVSLRGGRPGEAAVYVDGALVRSVLEGGANLVVGTNTLEEVSVTTGAIGAEFGDAQSGVIAFNTRAGGPTLDGSFSYETDEPFGDATSVGFNRIEGALSGPVTGNLTFALAGTLQGQQAPFHGRGFEQLPVFVPGGVDTVVTEVLEAGIREVPIPRFVQYSGTCDAGDNFGIPCQGRRAPYAWSSAATAQAKLQYTYGSGSRISLTGLYSQDQGRIWDAGNNRGGDAFAPQQWDGFRSWSNALILNWSQEVFRSPERALALDLNLSYQTDQLISGAMTRDYEIHHRAPFGGFAISPVEFLFDFDTFSYDDPNNPRSVTSLNSQEDWDLLIDNVRTNRGTRAPLLNQNQFGRSQPFRTNPYGMATGFDNETGLVTPLTLSDETRLQGRFNVDWQLDRFNRLKLGGDVRWARVNHFNTGVSILTEAFNDVYSETPVTSGLYAQNRLDLGDVVVELGLRWDYFDTGALIARDAGRIFTHPDFEPTITDPANLYGVFRPMNSHSLVSPRLLVSFPVTERAGFRLSYAHLVQSPDLLSIMSGINSDLSLTEFNIFPGDVTFGKSIQIEFGGRYAFSRDMVLDVAAYNKDKQSDLAVRNLLFADPTQGDSRGLQVLTNADFGNVRGVDLTWIHRLGDIVSANLSYTFQTAKSTGSDPFTFLRRGLPIVSPVTGERVAPPQSILPTDDNRTHNVAGVVAVTLPDDFAGGTWYGSLLQESGAFVRFRFASGLPYTKLRNEGVGNRAPPSAGGSRQEGPYNGSTMPWIRDISLRVTKSLTVGTTHWTAYADVRNLLDFRNVTSLFAETGGVVNDRHRAAVIGGPVARLQGEAGAFFIPGENPAVALPGDCGEWDGGRVNCVMLKAAEARWGNGDGLYEEAEYLAAFNAYYEVGWGAWRFLAPPRHIRIGVEVSF